MRSWMTVLSCVLVLFCVGQVERSSLPPVIDQECPPDGGKVNACLRTGKGKLASREYQQRITVGQDGMLARIEVTACEKVPLVVGLSRGAPWIGNGAGDASTIIWGITTEAVKGDPCYNGYVWVPTDLSGFGWQVKKGDVLTLHIWPQESICLGFQYYFGKDYEGGEMWISCKNPDRGGHRWGCKDGHADIDFRLSVSE